MKGSLGKVEVTFICKKYVNGNVDAQRVDKEKVNCIVEGVETVENFCYLGDMIQRDTGCDKAVRDRVRERLVKI